MKLAFLLILFAMYITINGITDVMYRKTKNIGHLLFLMIGIATAIQYSHRSLVGLTLVIY